MSHSTPHPLQSVDDQAEGAVHLQTSIFAMDLLQEVLQRSQARSQLPLGERERVYEKIRFRWQEALREKGHLSIPRAFHSDESASQPHTDADTETERDTDTQRDPRLSASLPAPRRLTGRLSGVPTPYMAPIPYVSSARSRDRDKRAWTRFVHGRGQVLGRIEEEFVPKRTTTSTAHNTAADTATTASSSSSHAPSASDSTAATDSTTVEMPLTLSRKRRRRTETDTAAEAENTLPLAAPRESLLLGMQLAIDPQFFDEGASSSTRMAIGRIVQIYANKYVSMSTQRGAASSCRVKLRNNDTGEELVVPWPHRCVSIYRPLDWSSIHLFPSQHTAETLSQTQTLTETQSLLPTESQLPPSSLLSILPADVSRDLSSDDFLEDIDADTGLSFGDYAKQTQMSYLDIGLASSDAMTSSWIAPESTAEDDAFFTALDAEADATSRSLGAGLDVALSSSSQQQHELVKLVTGEITTQQIVDQIEQFFSNQMKKRKTIVFNKSTSNPDECDRLLDDEDPDVPPEEPKAILVGKLRRMVKPGNQWFIALQDVYIIDNHHKRDKILPVVNLTIDSSKLFADDEE